MSRLDVRTGAVAGFLVGVLPGIAAAQCAGEDYASYIHRLGVLDTPGQAKAITSSGSIAYVADENEGLAVVDLADPSAPILRGRVDTTGSALDVFVEAIPFIETRGYVVRVMGNLARYGYLEKGEAGVPTISLDLKSAAP